MANNEWKSERAEQLKINANTLLYLYLKLVSIDKSICFMCRNDYQKIKLFETNKALGKLAEVIYLLMNSKHKRKIIGGLIDSHHGFGNGDLRDKRAREMFYYLIGQINKEHSLFIIKKCIQNAYFAQILYKKENKSSFYKHINDLLQYNQNNPGLLFKTVIHEHIGIITFEVMLNFMSLLNYWDSGGTLNLMSSEFEAPRNEGYVKKIVEKTFPLIINQTNDA